VLNGNRVGTAAQTGVSAVVATSATDRATADGIRAQIPDQRFAAR
jgi:hypothetical protein